MATCLDLTVAPNMEATVWTDEIGSGYSTPDLCEELEVDGCEWSPCTTTHGSIGWLTDSEPDLYIGCSVAETSGEDC